MKKLLLLLSLISTTVFSDPWSSWTKITRLYPYSGGLIFFTTYKNTDLSSCEGGTRFQLPKTHPNYETLASVLIAAYMSKKQIYFNIDSGQPKSCAPRINRFLVKD